jgi:hypothetical protein
MIAFDIVVNEKKVCTAGVDSDYGMLTAILSWAKRDLSRLPAEVRTEVPGEALKMVVSGQRNLDGSDSENLQWTGCDLKPGDEIRIAIVDVDRVDAPASTEKVSPNYVKKKPSDRMLH